jgi:hypothetical protein
LEPRTEVAADEAANAGDEPDGPVGRDVVSSSGDREENVVIAPTADVINVETSVAGATVATGIPRPTSMGLSSDPPPIP